MTTDKCIIYEKTTGIQLAGSDMQIHYAAISECVIHVGHGGSGKVNHAAGG